MTSVDSQRIAIAIVLVHLAVTFVHGSAHRNAGVNLNSFGYLYVLIVIVFAPLVAAIILYTSSMRAGLWLLTLSMAGSFCFGVINHFILSGTDNLMEVHGPWHSLFKWSAIAIAVVELIGTLCGLLLLKRVQRSQTSNNNLLE